MSSNVEDRFLSLQNVVNQQDAEIQKLKDMAFRLLGEVGQLKQSLSAYNSKTSIPVQEKSTDDALTTSLNAAWQELERKQHYLQDATDANAALLAQIDLLSGQKKGDQSDDAAMSALTSSLHEAWAELERKQKYLEDEVASGAAYRVKIEILQAELAHIRKENEIFSKKLGVLVK